MRSPEVLAKIIEANKINDSISINKGATAFREGFMPLSLNKRAELYSYILTLSTARLNIRHSERVVNSMIKKVKAMGFSVNEIDRHIWDFGRHDVVLTINKN